MSVGLDDHKSSQVGKLANLLLTIAGSRRLIVYARLPDRDIDGPALKQYEAMRKDKLEKGTADELNEFRKRVSISGTQGYSPLTAYSSSKASDLNQEAVRQPEHPQSKHYRRDLNQRRQTRRCRQEKAQ